MATQQQTTVLDPRTGKAIAANDLSEHMRIELLDPKWREERQRMLDKHKDTNFATDIDIADNLASFAQQRPDIFKSSSSVIEELDKERRGQTSASASAANSG